MDTDTARNASNKHLGMVFDIELCGTKSSNGRIRILLPFFL